MRMDHEQCSDLLPRYVQGELHADTAAEVRAHLESCPDCRAEESAVRAIHAAPVKPMTDIERTRLHRTLRDRLDVPQRTPARMAWLPPALTAAALLLALVVGIQVMSGTGGGGDDAEGVDAGGGAAESGGGGGPTPRTFSLKGGDVVTFERRQSERAEDSAFEGNSDQGLGTGGSQAGSAPDAGAPTEANTDSFPSTLSADRDKRELLRFARRQDTLVVFARAYSASDVESLRDDFIDVLSHDAPNVSASSQVEECDDLVAQAQDSPLLPVVAAHGRFDDRPSLVLGYLSSEDDDGPLNRFTFFVWRKGDCSIPIHSTFGRVRI
jgi:hypothetical protein